MLQFVQNTILSISLRAEVWAHKITLAPPLFIEVPVSNQECEQ
jgi:hypothetical protein